MVPGFGCMTQSQFDDAIAMGAIVKRENIYAIATEERLVSIDEKGRKLNSPEKVIVASNAWYQFTKKYDSQFRTT